MKLLRSLLSISIIYLFITFTYSWQQYPSSFRFLKSFNSPTKSIFSARQIPSSATKLHFRTSEEADEGESTGFLESGEKSSAQLKAERLLFFKRISKGIVPLAASMGFAVTPSSKALFRIAGAAAGGVAGILAKQAVDTQIKTMQLEEDSNNNNNNYFDDDDTLGPDNTVPDRIFEFPQKVQLTNKEAIKPIEYPGWEYTDSGLLRQNSLIPEEVALAVERSFTKFKKFEDNELIHFETIAKSCKVKEDDLSLYFTLLLSEYFYQYTSKNIINNPTSSTSVTSIPLNFLEFQLLFDFIKKIDFTYHEIADAITLAANNIGKKLNKDEFGFYSNQFTVKEYLHATNMFYLADKFIGSFQGYYGQRAFASLAYFPHDEYKRVITDACSKLFIKILMNIVESPEKFNGEKFKDVKYLLTTTSDEASNFTSTQVDMLIKQFFINLGEYYLNINGDDRTIYTVSLPTISELSKFQEIFNWDYSTIQKILEPITKPIYRKIVDDTFSKITADSSLGKQFEGLLEERMKALHIPLSLAKDIIKSEINNLNEQAIHNIMAAYNASGQDLDLTYRQIVSYAIAVDEIAEVTKNIFPYIKPFTLSQFPLSKSNQVFLYSQNLIQKAKNAEKRQLPLQSSQKLLTDEQLDTIFDVSKDVLDTAYRLLIVPKMVEFVRQCIKEKNFKIQAKEAYERRWKSENFTEESWQQVATTIYYEEADKISKSAKIPSQDDMALLQQAAEFLGLPRRVVEEVHVAAFGEKYLRSIEECMSTTGVITPEYMQSLDRLQERLLLSPKDAAYLYNVAIMNRFGPNLYEVYDLFKSITDPAFDVKKVRELRKQEEAKAAKKREKLRKKRGLIDETEGESDEDLDDDEEDFDSKYAKPKALRDLLAKRKKERIAAEEEEEREVENDIPDEDLSVVGNPKTEFQKSLMFIQRRDRSDEVERTTFMKEVVNLVDLVHENYQVQNFDDELLDRANYPIKATEYLNASESIDMYRYFAASKLLETNPSLKQRFNDADAKFGNVLGLSWRVRNNVKQMLLQDIYAATITNLLETKDAIEPNDLQQFYYLANEFNVTSEKLRQDLQEYTIRRGIDDYANSFLTKNDEEDDAPDGKLNPKEARRFRKQVMSLS